MAPYGFLGLGIMGEAMARNLLKLGAGVVIYNRSADKARSTAPHASRLSRVAQRCAAAKRGRPLRVLTWLGPPRSAPRW